MEFYTDKNAGLCSNFNRILTFLLKCQPISVRWRMFGKKEGCMGYNTEDELFNQIFDEYGLQTVDEVVISSSWGHLMDPERITGPESSQYYGMNRYKLEPYSNVYKKFFNLKHDFKLLLDQKIAEMTNGKKVVGIIVRNSGNQALAGEQLRNRMPTREEYKEQIDQFNGNRFFLCVDNEDDLTYFKTICPDSYHTDIRRSVNSNDEEPHKKTVAGKDEFIKTFIEIYLCSFCDVLIHPITNMATTSLILNPDQKSIPIM